MKVGVIAVTHESVHSPLVWQRQALDWRLQSNPNWELYLVHDGTPSYEGFFGLETLDSRINCENTKLRYQFWGHYGRQEYIAKLETDLIYITNADNIHSSSLVDITLKEFENNPKLGLLAFQCSHHYFGMRFIQTGLDFQIDHIDWCCMVVRKEIAKGAEWTPTYSGADGQYARSCKELCDNLGYDTKILSDVCLVFQQ